MHGRDAAQEWPCRPGRHAAGQDPAKRDQILNGAHRVFSGQGFDAASMNDIAREASVSKGTLYVYFANKEELFESLMERERELLFRDVEDELAGPGTLTEKLHRYAGRIARLLCSDVVVQAHRTVIGVSERMPEIGARFYERGGQRGNRILKTFLESEVARGSLAIDDIDLAAYQFTELSMAGLFRRRLFGHMPDAPDAAAIERSVTGAVNVFLRAYGTDHPAAR